MATGGKVQRGVATVAGRRGEGRNEPPKVVRPVLPDPPRPAHSFAYVTEQGRFHQLEIYDPPEHDRSERAERARAARLQLPQGFLQFTDWRAEFPWISVAAYLDGEIKAGRAVGYGRDAATFKVRCAYCDRLFSNSGEGQKEMMQHVIDEHEGFDNDVHGGIVADDEAGGGRREAEETAETDPDPEEESES